MAAYDTFWQERQLRPQVGVRMNLPLRAAKRDAAVREAEAKVAERIAEAEPADGRREPRRGSGPHEAAESDETVRLYKETVLAAAEQNVKSIQPLYTTGKTPFLNLIDAERSVIDLRNRYYEATADAFRRRAALERAVGGPVQPLH